jgi:hypothetical protein
VWIKWQSAVSVRTQEFQTPLPPPKEKKERMTRSNNNRGTNKM